MNLHDWIKSKRLSYAKAAQALGLPTATTARRYAKGEHIPRPPVMQQILEATSGAVTPADFYFDRLGQAGHASAADPPLPPSKPRGRDRPACADRGRSENSGSKEIYSLP